MKIGQVVRSLASGTALYVVMAACGASDRAGGAAAIDGGGGLDAEKIADAFVDELADPVGEASAGPVPPDVATEPCTKVLKYGSTTTVDYYVAEHAYPGKSAVDLTALRVAFTPSVAPLEGYTHQQSLPLLRDGSAAVMCSPVSSGASPYSVVFVLPK